MFYTFFASNRIAVLLQFLLHVTILIWSINFIPGYFTIIIELLLGISLNYNVLADFAQFIGEWHNASKWRENITKFKELMKEISDLQSSMKKINDVLYFYNVLYVTMLTINTTGLFVANMAKADSAMELASLLPFSLWQIAYLIAFCILGDLGKESVKEE